MAQGPRSGFRLGIILAMAVILVAITTWEVSRNNLKSASAGSIPPSEVIYRSQHLNLF
jgi:cytochrome oxidase assembly protein ShyY1